MADFPFGMCRSSGAGHGSDLFRTTGQGAEFSVASKEIGACDLIFPDYKYGGRFSIDIKLNVFCLEQTRTTTWQT